MRERSGAYGKGYLLQGCVGRGATVSVVGLSSGIHSRLLVWARRATNVTGLRSPVPFLWKAEREEQRKRMCLDAVDMLGARFLRSYGKALEKGWI